MDDVLPLSAEPLLRTLLAKRHTNNHSLILAAGSLVPALVEQSLESSQQRHRVVVVNAERSATFDYQQLTMGRSPASLLMVEPSAASMTSLRQLLEGWRDQNDCSLVVVLHGINTLLHDFEADVAAVAALTVPRSLSLWSVEQLGAPPARFAMPTHINWLSSCALRVTNAAVGIPLLVRTTTPGDVDAALHLPTLRDRQALVWSSKVSLHSY